MPGWVGPTVALSLLVIAVAVVLVLVALAIALLAAKKQIVALGKELRELRGELSPTIAAVRRVSEQGLDVVRLAEDEAKAIVESSRRVRYDVERGVRRVKRRLADFDASVEVVQEEIDATVIEVSAALETARTGAGMIGQLRRLVRSRRRGAA
jgi:hypothetical protein